MKQLIAVLILAGFSITATADKTVAGYKDGESENGDRVWLQLEFANRNLVYAATKEACSKNSVADLYGGLGLDRLRGGDFRSHKFNRLTSYILSEAFAKNTIYLKNNDQNENEAGLIYSEGYERALKECYPSERDRERFHSFVTARSSAGAIAGAVVQLVALSKGLRSAGKVLNFSKYLKWIWGTGSDLAVVAIPTYTQLKKQMAKDEQCKSLSTIDCEKVQNDVPINRDFKAEAREALETEIARLRHKQTMGGNFDSQIRILEQHLSNLQ